jgi:hypothetical protein
MTSIDHGQWHGYVPQTFPDGAPAGTLFTRRDSDGIDWYQYIKDGTAFQSGTVKFAARFNEQYQAFLVSVALYDPTMMFPGNQIIREITDYTGSDPQADFGSKIYDPNTDTFSDPPPFTGWPTPASRSVEERLAALEAKVGGT